MFPSSTGSFALHDIDSSISQSKATEDCWLLAGIYALSQNEKGLKILNESVYKNLLGTQVYFKGIDQMVPIDGADLFRAEENRLFSCGSESYLIFELAFEKLRIDIIKGKVKFPKNTAKYLKLAPLNPFRKKICMGYASQVFYYLTGKEPRFMGANFSKHIDMFKDMTKFAACCSFNLPVKTYRVTECYKEREVELYSRHSYCITAINEDSCVIVNPHDTSRKIILNKYEFCALLRDIEYCEL